MSNRAILAISLTACLIGFVVANFAMCAIGVTTPETAADRSVFQTIAYVGYFVTEAMLPYPFEREN